MVARHIDDEDSLDFRANRADVGGVSEIYDMAEAFEGSFFKIFTVPHLGMKLIQLSAKQRIPTYLEPVERESLVERDDARGAAHHPLGTVVAFEMCHIGRAVGAQSRSTQRVT